MHAWGSRLQNSPSIAWFHKIPGLEELWVAFGRGKQYRYIPVHQIAKSLGADKSKTLLGFHAFTGCYSVSAFYNIGKKGPWQVWKEFPQVTEAFLFLSSTPTNIPEHIMALLEEFVRSNYCRQSSICWPRLWSPFTYQECSGLSHSSRCIHSWSHMGTGTGSSYDTAQSLYNNKSLWHCLRHRCKAMRWGTTHGSLCGLLCQQYLNSIWVSVTVKKTMKATMSLLIEGSALYFSVYLSWGMFWTSKELIV